MVELLKEAQDETKHRDLCIDEMAKNERSTSEQVHTKAKVQANIERLEMTIKDLGSTISTLQAEIADLKLQRERAKEDRAMENKEFENTVADQRETQRLLTQALDVLKTVYAKETTSWRQDAAPNAGFVQLQAPPSPEGFDVYEKSRKSSGILSLLEHILEGAKAMEVEVLRAEQQSLADYQDFVQQTVRSVEAKEQSVLGRQGEKAQNQEELTQAGNGLGEVNDELESLSTGLAGLKGECDFFLKNFEARSQARGEEVEALRQAKAALSGMSAL